MSIFKKLFNYLFGKNEKIKEESKQEKVVRIHKKKKDKGFKISDKVLEESFRQRKDSEYICEDSKKVNYSLEKARKELRLQLDNLEYRLERESLPDNNLEKQVILTLEKIKDKESKVLWNVYPKYYKEGKEYYSQVDIIYITAYKIYVIECKEYETCLGIQGGLEDKTWKYTYKKRDYFSRNPIYQNQGHIWTLRDFLDLNEKYFESIVIFVTSDNVKERGEQDRIIYLKNKDREQLEIRLEEKLEEERRILNKKDIVTIGNKLLDVMNPDEYTVRKHIESIERKRED